MYVAGKGHQHWGPGTSMTQMTKPGTFFGMGACCDSCAHGGGCSKGMGVFNSDGTGLFGSGIFGDSVSLFDVSTWTWHEWVTAFGAAYVLISVFSTTKRVGRGVRHAAGAPGRGIRSVKSSVGKSRKKLGRVIGGGRKP